MQIKVDTEWMTTCGFERFAGLVFEVTNVRDFGSRGKFYTVTLPNGYLWEVWDARGVTVVEPGAETPAKSISAEEAKISIAPEGVSDHAMTGAWRVIIARHGEHARTWYYHSNDAHMHKAALRQQADEWFYAHV